MSEPMMSVVERMEAAIEEIRVHYEDITASMEALGTMIKAVEYDLDELKPLVEEE